MTVVPAPEEREDDHTFVGLFDAHCHPTDTMTTIEQIPTMNATALTIMATRAQDQALVEEVADKHAITTPADARETASDASHWRQIVPSFGWHPWFSYQMYDDTQHPKHGPLSDDEKTEHHKKVLTPSPKDEAFLENLPQPKMLSTFIDETRRRLQKHPLALIGEVGLDRAFRLPEAWLPGQADSRDTSLTPGGREGRRLSPYKVEQNHQIAVLLAQLRLAGEMQRACSVHGVQAHGVLYDTLKKTWAGHEKEVISSTERKRRVSVSDAHDAEENEPPAEKIPQQISRPYPPRVCLHSFSGPVEFLRQYFHPSVPVEFYCSFSMVINFSTSAASKTEEVIRQVPEDRLLIESDMHIAGQDMDARLAEMAYKVCDLRGWDAQEGVERLRMNWHRFVFGSVSGSTE